MIEYFGKENEDEDEEDGMGVGVTGIEEGILLLEFLA